MGLSIKQKQHKMKTQLKKYTIWYSTEFGIGCREMKGLNFFDAFKRLGKKEKNKDGWIEDEDGQSHTFNEILGIEETT
jgi:hypothetical protein